MQSYPLVGSYYRPPAKAILNLLPAGAPLTIVPEPDNPYDPNALAVYVASDAIPSSQYEALDGLASSFGHNLAAILAKDRWHLGYIDRHEAAILAPSLQHYHNPTLGFGARGPLVFLEEAAKDRSNDDKPSE